MRDEKEQKQEQEQEQRQEQGQGQQTRQQPQAADDQQRHAQAGIVRQFGVRTDVDPRAEIERRVAFLQAYLREQRASAYVLGISGGVDSTTAGRLAQLAVEGIRKEGGQASFIAMRLPYGAQIDEAEAQQALAFIRPDQVVTVDIKPASDALLAEVRKTIGERDPASLDFLFGNIKSRQRMVAQYALAGAHGGLVLGTDHAAEALMGFFTKYGDGAFDVTALAHLNKRQIRAIAQALGAPATLVNKVPTADLEDLAPQKPDELAFGVSYDEIDDFLEGKPVSASAAEKIITAFTKTAHKRALPGEIPLEQ